MIEKLEYYSGGKTNRDGTIFWSKHPDFDDVVDKINEIIDYVNLLSIGINPYGRNKNEG